MPKHVIESALNKTAVGLGNVDNTSDLTKPISTATQTALNGKSNTGHGHSFAEITGTLSSAQLPPLAVNETFVVATQVASSRSPPSGVTLPSAPTSPRRSFFPPTLPPPWPTGKKSLPRARSSLSQAGQVPSPSPRQTLA